MAERPYITCHVLDTTTGKPAPGIAVKLKLISPDDAPTSLWAAVTNSDGRVPDWSASTDINQIVESAKRQLGAGGEMVWNLTFETEAYFGKGKTFWPQVELRFATQCAEEHYHVPLLLGPWSYTTYSGS